MSKASEQQGDEQLQEALFLFKNALDSDIEFFMQNKAVDYENKGLSTTYLSLNVAMLEQNRLQIEGFFTLSHKSIEFAEDAPKKKIKEVAGFKDRTSTHVILIGQLGKYIGGNRQSLTCGQELLSDAFGIIEKSSQLIVCRAVLVECSDEEKVHQFYERNGFTYLQHDGQHHQFFKRIDR